MQKKVESISQWKQTGQRASLGRISTRVGARVKSGSIGGHKFIFGERGRLVCVHMCVLAMVLQKA